jgi:hypothetical protein
LRLSLVADLAEIPAAEWDALLAATGGGNPFLKHAFLLALQESGCATPKTGWQAQYLTLWAGERLAGAVPLYLKSHSWGEFVFDWAWAEAYQRSGFAYYPKLIAAVPFTPVTGPRLLAATAEARIELARAALALARELDVSSLHILFPGEAEARELEQAGLMLRRNVQFHWRNPGYANFADYLAALRHDKRKKIHQERRKGMEAGIHFQRLRGAEITAEHWHHFMACYQRTHEQHNSPQALNLDFFQRIGAAMPENLLLVVALRGDQAIAAALDLYDEHALYGRSWGALEYHPGLHFETCYYQAIEFCIEQRIATFEGGAQGEHKHARGFQPSTTWSGHWLAHPRYADAVENFLRRETGGIEHYIDELNEHDPFKRT